jgi:outer membrane biosynthesis protein TonB
MNQHNLKRFINISLIGHIILLVIVPIIVSYDNRKEHLLIFGSYSKTPTLFSFKPLSLKERSQSSLQTKPQKLKKKNAQLKEKAKAKKLLEKKALAEQKKQSKKKKQEQTRVKEEEEKHEEVQKDLHEEMQAAADEAQEEVTETGQVAQLSDALQRELQREVDRVWAPPLGVPKGTECILEITLDKQGNVKAWEFKEKSNILLFDVSVEEITSKLSLGRLFWNKSFQITFRQ